MSDLVFSLSQRAAEDLDEIIDYITQKAGANRAMLILNRLDGAFQKLSEYAQLGHRREDLTRLPVLFYTIWPYMIIYKYDANALEIVRILHGARDVGAILKDGADLE